MRALGTSTLLVVLAVAVPAHAADSGLGRNLAGETCRIGAAPTLVKNGAIVCGENAVEAGTLRASSLAALPSGAAARAKAVIARAEAMRRADAEEATCGPAQDLGGGFVLSLCTLGANGWPHVILAATSHDRLYEADGMPAMLPVLARALGSLTGTSASAAAAAAVKRVSARVPTGVLHASAGDVAHYKADVEAGRLASGAEDYAGAEAAYRHALAIETKLFGPDSVPVGQTLAELALQVSNQGRFDEAAALFHRATPIIQGSDDTASRARLASYLALNAANQRKFADALKLARQATAERRAALASASGTGMGASDQPEAEGELSHSLRLEAEMALRLGDLAAARAAADEALWIVFQEPGLPLWWRPAMLSLMGDINAASGRVLAAEHNFKDAVDLDNKLFGNSARTAAAQMHLGAFYDGQQLYGPALAAYRAAFRIFAADKLARSHVMPDQLLPYFDAAVAGKATEEEIFTAAQLVGGGVNDQTIARMAARQAASTPALAEAVRALQAAERARDTARIELAAENSKADEDRDPKRVATLSAELKSSSARYDALAAKVRASYPAYTRLASPGPASLAAVQHALDPDAAFLSFVIGAKGGYALLVKPDGLMVRKIDISAPDLAADVAALRRAFVPTLGRVPPFSLKSSYALYKKVLGPFESDLTGTRTLIVAPSPALASLPLALLVTAPPGRHTDYTNAAWLIRKMAISDVPSPRAFLALVRAEKTAKPAPQPLLALAAPGFHGGKNASLDALANACIKSGPISPALLRGLPPLPGTAREAERVAHSLGANPGDVLTGAAASEADLRRHDLADYAILYFATHGLLPGELHCQSQPALALAPPAHASSTSDDGLLTASEVAGLNLNADLVVLSACNTAAGGSGRFGGSALEGLADAFFEAGARAVLASHWQVPSAHTVSLMTDLFAHYGNARREGFAAALRQAQLALIANPATAHPFNWAAFTLIGDGEPAPSTGAQQARAYK